MSVIQILAGQKTLLSCLITDIEMFIAHTVLLCYWVYIGKQDSFVNRSVYELSLHARDYCSGVIS